MAGETSEVKLMRLGDIRGQEGNPKAHDPSISASIRRFGFCDPPAVDEDTGLLVEGHGRIEALAAMAASEEAPPEHIELADDGHWLVPVIRGLVFKDAIEAKAYVLAHNRISERGGWNADALQAMLEEVYSSDYSLDGIGFTEADVDSIAAEASTIADAAVSDDVPRLPLMAPGLYSMRNPVGGDEPSSNSDPTPPTSFKEIDPEENLTYCCPKCGYGWNGSAK
jgi:hypothetical protein